MRVVLARSWFAAAARSVLVFGAMLLVAAIMYAAKGPPQSSRDVRRNEIERFAPRLAQGVVELSGEMLILVLLAWGCREGLKIRL